MTDNIKLPPHSIPEVLTSARKYAEAYAREAVRLNAQAAPAAPQPTDEKDALLRQALEALEPFELSTSLAERTAEAIRSHLGVKP